MSQKVFYTFHYKPDVTRVARVRNIGAIEGQTILDGNKWEEVKKGGDPAIEAWIAKEMAGKKCQLVLIGSATAGRKWVKHEIKKAWADGLGVVGIHIHNLVDLNLNTATKGKNPFDAFTLGADKKPMSSVVKTYDPAGANSTAVYNTIKDNVEGWIDEAIRIRKNWP